MSLQDYRKAGFIARSALDLGISMIKPGVKYLDVVEACEKRIIELGGGIAFPAQVSVNNVAAHYCPDANDSNAFKEGDLVKLDVGAHINGCIGDNAFTVNLGDHHKLKLASLRALGEAISIIKPGVKTSEIGRVIQDTIQGYGYQPVKNLSGHGVAPYKVHTAPTIPNYDTKDDIRLKEGQFIAIEPFATDGKGMIFEQQDATVFMFSQKRPVRSESSRLVLKEIQKYNGLPFTTRWLTKKIPAFKVSFALKELTQAGVIHAYPPLPEVSKGFVAQHEHTVHVAKDGAEVLTTTQR